MLSREDMCKVIREGGSVLLPDGRVIRDEAGLPSDSALAIAQDDPVQKAKAKDALLARKAEIDDQIAALDRPAPPKAEAPQAKSDEEAEEADAAKEARSNLLVGSKPSPASSPPSPADKPRR